MRRFLPTGPVLLIGLTAGLACAPRPGALPAGRAIALPFIENDFKLAQDRAREASLPLFVEVWAPW